MIFREKTAVSNGVRVNTRTTISFGAGSYAVTAFFSPENQTAQQITSARILRKIKTT